MAGSTTRRSGAVERVPLQLKIGAEIDQGGLDRFVPSHRAMTEVSMPACRSRITYCAAAHAG